MKAKVLILLFQLLTTQAAISSISAYDILTGTITDKSTGNPIPDANIIVEGTLLGTASGDGGFYRLSLPAEDFDITVKVIGYKPETKHIDVKKTTSMDFTLTPRLIPMNPIIVTATGTDHLQSQVSVSSRILVKEDMDNINGETAAEILEPAGGLYVKSYGGITGFKSLSLRGSESAQVLVLLDGQRLNSPQDGGVNLNSIPVNALDRIEIIRGGHSAFTGTDPLGGIIHLISNESIPEKGYSYHIRTTFGSFGTKGFNLNGAHRIGPLRLFLSYNTLGTDGNYSFSDPLTREEKERENNDADQQSLFIKAKVKTGRQAEMNVLYQNMKTDQGSPGALTWLTPLAEEHEKRQRTQINYSQQLFPYLRTSVQTFYQITERTFEDPNGWPTTLSEHEHQALGVSTLLQWTPYTHFKINTGVDYRKDELESTDVGSQNRTLVGMMLNGEWKPFSLVPSIPMKVILYPAFRWDHYSDFDALSSSKLGLVIYPGENTNLSLRGNIGQSYRAPTFNDLYWPEDMFSKGNPELEPEKSSQMDAGFRYQMTRSGLMQLDMTAFHNTITDLIQWQPGADWKWKPVNVGKAKISGLEAGLTLRMPDNMAHFIISHTWMKAVDATPDSPNNGKRLIYRPDLKLDIQTGLVIEMITFNLHYQIVGKQFTNAGNTEQRDDYQILNGNIGFHFSFSGFQLDIKAEAFNLLNRDITILEGYPLPGREFRLSLGLQY